MEVKEGWFKGMEGESDKKGFLKSYHPKSILPMLILLAECKLHFLINLSAVVLKSKDTHALYFQK